MDRRGPKLLLLVGEKVLRKSNYFPTGQVHLNEIVSGFVKLSYGQKYSQGQMRVVRKGSHF